MRKLKKLDFLVLNKKNMNSVVGGIDADASRTLIDCYFGFKLYLCASWEVKCPQTFNYGCSGGFEYCSKSFSLKPIKNY